jgi:hypothetical protein
MFRRLSVSGWVQRLLIRLPPRNENNDGTLRAFSTAVASAGDLSNCLQRPECPISDRKINVDACLDALRCNQPTLPALL